MCPESILYWRLLIRQCILCCNLPGGSGNELASDMPFINSLRASRLKAISYNIYTMPRVNRGFCAPMIPYSTTTTKGVLQSMQNRFAFGKGLGQMFLGLKRKCPKCWNSLGTKRERKSAISFVMEVQLKNYPDWDGTIEGVVYTQSFFCNCCKKVFR